jgi:pimeloyl-ACP methyl ester carboxylesterase
MSDAPPALPGVRHEYVTVGGLRLHVALAGEESAPPLLLVHGWPQHWWAWREVIGHLAATHRVIAPDLPGYGWSEPAANYEKEHLAGILLGLLDALGVEQVTWVGHDWGGWIGYLAALRAPERIDRMLTVAIPHPWMGSSLRQTLVVLSYQVPISLPGIGPRIATPMIRRILQTGRGRDRLDPATRDSFALRIPPAVTVAMYRTFLTRELPELRRGRLRDAELRVPTTALVGGADMVTTGARPGPVPGQPAITQEIVEGAAHWIPELQPEAVLRWVAAPS